MAGPAGQRLRRRPGRCPTGAARDDVGELGTRCNGHRRGAGRRPAARPANEGGRTMRAVTPPPSGARMQRSVAASLAAILEIDPAEVPVPDDGHPQPWTVWSQWLMLRGLGLVPIVEPGTFIWPGPWLAVLA